MPSRAAGKVARVDQRARALAAALRRSARARSAALGAHHRSERRRGHRADCRAGTAASARRTLRRTRRRRPRARRCARRRSTTGPALKNAPSTRFSTVGVERRVGAHVGRVLAAELETCRDEALAAAARCTAWPPATEPVKATNATRASPITGRDLIVIDVQVLEDAVGQAGGRERFGVALGDERRLLRHLQDHAVAGEDRRDDRVDRGEPGVVPRREHEHDAERLAPDEALEILLWLDRDVGERALGDRRSCSATRSGKPRRISNGLCAIGRPICQVSSSPSSSARSTHHAAMRRQIAPPARRRGTAPPRSCAVAARASAASICRPEASSRST